MQVTIDILEAKYLEFKQRAESQHRSVEDIVLSETLRNETDEQFQERMRHRYPLIRSERPGSMIVPEGGFNDAIFTIEDDAA